MICGQCGAAAQADQRFCGHCGATLAGACPDCGQENPPEHRFCGGCGSPLSPDPVSRAEPLADRPVSTERRVVSVLFVDLVGFTSFSQHRDPEEVRELITEYFELAQEVIDRFGGTVDKYIGDAVMAWWGATTSNEDDAERAVRTALELVDRVGSLEKPGMPPLRARAGVMTGEVAVGPGGNERGLLLGDLVNSTSRLQSLAEPGMVYVGDETAALISKAIGVVPAGTHRVKGKDEPIVAARAVRVISERGGRGRADVLEPPFVGRTSELRLLKDSLHATGKEQRARLVSLVGQAGIGKSRLIWEFMKYVDGLVETVYWHQGRSPAYGNGVALWALGEMIRRRAKIQETDHDEVTAERLQAAVSTYIEDPRVAEWARERLAALLGLGDSAGTERTELFAAARAFFEGIARHGTTVLVFEDLHWADPSLLEFIEDLPNWSHNHPILVITVARPDLLDGRPDWGSGRRGFASLYLGPLADDEMTDLITGAVPGIPEQAVSRIVTAADGVPLFAVEMLRTLLTDDHLVVEEGVVSVVGGLEHIEVPSTVQAVISARLDRLPAGERDLVRVAAVLGQSFTLDALSAQLEEEPDKLERRLSDLIRHEILELVRDPRSPERGQYRWVQSLLKEVAYGRISKGDRHQLHLRAARYFRDLGDPELAPIAASHYLSASEYVPSHDAGLAEEVVAALRAAIARAQALHAHELLLSLVESALPVVPPDVEIELREIAALAAVRLNDLAIADLHTNALREVARTTEDLAITHRAMALLGLVANETRRSVEWVETLAEHVAAHPDLHSDPNLARVAVYLARSRLLGGDDRAAAVIADDALEAVEHFGLMEEIADAMVTRGTALSRTQIHHAIALLRGALRICEEHELTPTKLRALINIGYASPEFEETVEATQRAFDEAKRVGDANRATFVAGNLFGNYLFRMRLDAAEALLEDPVLRRTRIDQGPHLANQAEILLRRGHVQEAIRCITEAKEALTEVKDPQARLNLERTEATLGVVQLDHERVFEIGRRHFEETPFAAPVSATIALMGAVIGGARERLEQAHAMAIQLPPGVFTTPLVEWAEVFLTLIDGDVEGAVERTEQLRLQFSGEGMLWNEYLLTATFARHLPPGHETRERYAARARQIAGDAGADGLTDWVDRLIAAPTT